MEANLNSLSNFMLSQMQRMEFIEDILHIDGSSIWQETFTTVLERCVKKEALELMACMQKSANVVKQLNNMSSPSTFFGLMQEAMNCLACVFFNLLELCLGQVGLACLDSLVHMLIKHSIENTVTDLHMLVDAKHQEDLGKLDDFLGPPASIPLMSQSSYKQMVKILYSSWGPLAEELATAVASDSYSLQTEISMQDQSKGSITSVVEVLVSSLAVQTVKSEAEEEDETVRFLRHGLKEQQNFCGLFSPLQVIYISEEPPMFLTRLLSLFSISQLSRYVLDVHLGNLTSPLKRSTADFSAVIIGLGTLAAV